MKLPAIQFYPADWRKDPGVQSLDYFDRGVWFELLLIMHEADERGKLVLNGRAMTTNEIATILHLSEERFSKTLANLLTKGVAKVEQSTGKVYNKRMVDDDASRRAQSQKKEHLREVRAAAGRKSAEQRANKKQQKRVASSSSSLAVSTTEKKEPSAHAELFKFLETKTGPIANPGKQGKAVKWLLDHGYDAAQIQACYESLAAEEWRTAAVDFATVQSQIGAWLLRHPPPRSVSRPAVSQPLPLGTSRWECPSCSFFILQNGNGIKDCPDCGKGLKVSDGVDSVGARPNA